MNIIYPLAIMASINLHAETFLGYADIQKGQLFAQNDTQRFRIEAPKKIIRETKSHLKFNPLLHFKNAEIKKDTLYITQTPSIQSG
ncbi:MAG: hypothetical protein OXE99_03350, partial [Cellvibrionales bacterium]|nr:hypothetical protein [Cellvibrionales bacterium]